jgi:hypothetical protein
MYFIRCAPMIIYLGWNQEKTKKKKTKFCIILTSKMVLQHPRDKQNWEKCIFCQRSTRWWWPTQLMMKNSCIQTEHSHVLRCQKSCCNWKALHNFTVSCFPFALNSFCYICGCCHTHSWGDMSYWCFYSITF